MAMRKLLAIVILLFGNLAFGDIAIVPPVEKIDVGRHYLLQVTGLEKEDLANTRLIVEPKESASAVGVTGWAGEQFIWFTGNKAGRHFLVVIVVRDGKPLAASLCVDVGGVNPDPPIPPEEDLWGAIIIEETSKRTPEFAKTILSPKMSSFFKNSGLELRIVDQDVVDIDGETPDDLKSYIDEAKTGKLPMLFVMGVKGTEYYKGNVPGSAGEMIELIQKFTKEEK